MEYRHLTPSEISQLQAAGNHAQDWNGVLIANDAAADDLAGIQSCTFGSAVRIGRHCTMRNIQQLSGYTIGDRCVLLNISEMTAEEQEISNVPRIEAMNENGGRSFVPFAGMTIGDAYLWARYRGHAKLMKKLEAFTSDALKTRGGYGIVGDHAVVKNTQLIRNVAIRSSQDDPTVIDTCIALTDGVIGYGCHLQYGIIAARFLLGEHVHLEFGLRLNDSVVGDNSTLARCEVGNSIIFPAHEQHHNNSFLIAALIMGQSNVAAGGTIGSNHNSRTADNEMAGGRGFWPGLCCSIKHSSQFASYCLLAKADYPNELNITLPFALVNNNASKDQLEVMPGYWWLYNMYALDRCSKKFAKRDKRVYKAQHIEFDNLAPDTAEELIIGRMLLKEWTEEAYVRARNSGESPEILAHGMEHSKRRTVVLKAAKGYQAYEDMLVHYAMKTLEEAYGGQLPPASLGEGGRSQKWVNIGGQIVSQPDMETLIDDVEKGQLSSWDDIHERLDELWQQYAGQKVRHAYHTLCWIGKTNTIDEAAWGQYRQRHAAILRYIDEQIAATRHKDDVNSFRNMTYWDNAERDAVLG